MGKTRICVKDDPVEDMKLLITKAIDSVNRKIDPLKIKGKHLRFYDMTSWWIMT